MVYEQDLDTANAKLKIATDTLETIIKWAYDTNYYPIDLLDNCTRIAVRALLEMEEI